MLCRGREKVNNISQRDVWKSLTLCILGLNEGLDEFVGGLSVEGQGVVQRQQVWTLLKECLLQSHTSSMEILLRNPKTTENA